MIDPMLPAVPPQLPPPMTTEGLQPVEIVRVWPKKRLPPEPEPDYKDVLADKEDLIAQHKERLLQTEATYRQLAARRADLDVGHFEDDKTTSRPGKSRSSRS